MHLVKPSKAKKPKAVADTGFGCATPVKLKTMIRIFRILFFILAPAMLLLIGGLAGFAQNRVKAPTPLKRCWEFGLATARMAEIAADDGVIYLAYEEGEITALDANTANILWKSEIGGRVISTMAFAETHILVASNPQGEPNQEVHRTLLRVLSKTTGLTDRTILLPRQDEVLLAQWEGIALAVSKSGWMGGFDIASGDKLWERAFQSELSARPMFTGGAVAIGTISKGVYLIDLKTGEELVSFNSNSAPTAVTSLKTRQIIYGSESGRIERIDAESKPIRWKFRAGGQISGIEPSGDRLLISSHDNFIYMVSQKGGIDWKKRLPGRPGENVLLTDGVGVVAIGGDGTAIVFNPENGRTVNRVDFGENTIQSIVLAGSGRIIFAIPGKILLYSSNGCSAG